MDFPKWIGRCMAFFLIAVLFDVVGLILFFIGLFAPLSFWDMFIFTGPLLIFCSLMFWILWYLGNLEMSVDQSIPYGDTPTRC